MTRHSGRSGHRAARIALTVGTCVASLTMTTPAAIGAPQAPPAVATLPAPAPAGTPAVVGALPTPGDAVLGGGGRQVRTTLKDLRINDAIRLAGTRGEIGIPFGTRADEVLTAAKLTLTFAYSPTLLEELSSMTVLINGEVVRNLPLPRSTADGVRVEIPVEPALVTPGDNRLNLRLIGHYTRDCEDPLHSSLWANISNTRSYLDMTFQRVATAPGFTNWPAPFFDAYDPAPLNLPFVFAGAPGDGELQAAAATASTFGSLASYRGFSFPARFGSLPTGDAVVFMTPDRQIPGLGRPITGPSAAVVRNPVDPFGSLLVIMGRDAGELQQAASALAYSPGAMQGALVDLSNANIPVLKPYEAPRWLSTDKVTKLGDIVDARSLVGQGLPPGRLSASFRLAPDLFFWPRTGGTVDARYRYPQGDWLNARSSRLDLSLNGQYLRTLPLTRRGWFDNVTSGTGSSSQESRASTGMPDYALFGQNRLDFFYDLIPADTGACASRLPENVQASILPTSTLDFRGARHAARLPNLALFASGGFPFTRTPDLGETAVVMPATAGAPEVEAFLQLMGQFGDATGAPVTRVMVTRSAQQQRLAGRDILVIGGDAAAAAPDLFRNAPAHWRQGQLETKESSPLLRLWNLFAPEKREGPEAVDAAMSAAGSAEGLIAFRSPYDAKRSVVAIFADQDARLVSLTTLLATDAAKAQAKGDLVLRVGPNLQSFKVGESYWTGDLPWWIAIGYWLHQRPFALALAALIAAALAALPVYFGLKRRAESRLRQGEKPE